jgi:hypothetical protein
MNKPQFEYPTLTLLSDETLRKLCREHSISDKGIRPTLIKRLLNLNETFSV